MGKLQHAGVVALRTFTGLVVGLHFALSATFTHSLEAAAWAGAIGGLVDLVAHQRI